MKLMHLIAKMDTGGAESLVVEMIAQGGTVGWESSLASAGGIREDELVQAGLVDEPIRVALAERKATGTLQAIRDARRAILQRRPDVVLAHNIGMTFIATAARTGLRHPPAIVSVFHGVAADDYSRAAKILRFGADHVVTVSDAIANRLIESGMTNTPFTVIRNAITMPALPSCQDARQKLGLDPEIPLAMCLARLAEQKRHDILLEAFAQVPEPAELLIVGDGPLEDALKAQTRQLSLDDRVHFLGRRRDIPSMLAAVDCTVLSSDWEGLPISVLESLAAGVPIVATDVDGLVEVLGHGGGILVPRRNSPALAGGLRTMLFDDDARRTAIQSGLRTIAELYGSEKMMNSYDLLLREVATTRHSTSHTLITRRMDTKK